MLFSIHISKVEEYHNETWKNAKSVTEYLARIKYSLSNHLFKIETILKNTDPEKPLPTPPAPLQLSHEHNYAKKVYGWSVISTLKDWLTQVLLVLKEEC